MTEDRLHHKVEALERELAKLRGELGGLVTAAKGAGQESGAPPQDNGDAAQEGAAGRFEHEIELAVEVGKRALHKLDEVAERRPVGSAVVAFSLGLIVARILGLGRGH